MILVKCANGVVAFTTHKTSKRIGDVVATCVNDQARIVIPYGPPAETLKAIELMFAHAVLLKGAIQMAGQFDVEA